ncbi:ATP-binding protein [Falsiroseomonas selenitidurans]|uniref:histidine kinase n=1 Tax=Falsiroseomonas selenitidurans TaxID=2716335 RepID=A0ABX1E9Z6_9PROT|nr:ATP-binding protein [Falsiroseomonas selenitidurans]NKC31750.1 HAMP domain-containing protein [Falsiroseomonas selenitidurans]
MRRFLRRWLGWLWPRSLAGRTALVLLGGLTLVQVAGLTIHALDRVDLQRFQQAREISQRAYGAWRSLLQVPPAQRPGLVEDLDMPPGLKISVDAGPNAVPGFPPPPPSLVRLLRLDGLRHAPPRFRPREVLIGTNGRPGRLVVSLRFPDQGWLNLRLEMPPPRPWHSETFLFAFVLMTLAAGGLTLWAVRRLTRPVAALAAAADRLGRDVNATPLPESGPEEVATAARAFNTMAERIRRFVGDRTQMLAAIGHDLKTPITRLKLRAEFLDDEEQRRKMLADLDEMEAMIAATLAFARDDSTREPSVPVDLVSLCRTVLDETADARPEFADFITYAGPEHLTVTARPGSLKRALANLVGNAVAYGGSAMLRLSPPLGGIVRIAVEDDGPGVPEADLETVFQPFRRLEASRNRETGGTGLGLPIARNIFRAHGGDVVLRNRPGGGLQALATMPV